MHLREHQPVTESKVKIMAEYTSNRPRAYSNPNKRAIRQLLAAEACEPMARRMAAEHPDRFKFHPTTWGKFPDGTDKIIIGGYTPTNELAGEHVCLRRPFLLSRHRCE